MPIPDDPGPSGWAAIWLTAALGAFGVAWKSWFGVRKDARDDRSGLTLTETYEAIIKHLRAELETERRLRIAAEQRVDELQAELRGMR